MSCQPLKPISIEAALAVGQQLATQLHIPQKLILKNIQEMSRPLTPAENGFINSVVGYLRSIADTVQSPQYINPALSQNNRTTTVQNIRGAADIYAAIDNTANCGKALCVALGGNGFIGSVTGVIFKDLSPQSEVYKKLNTDVGAASNKMKALSLSLSTTNGYIPPVSDGGIA
ncbi:hypothetical protein PFICI_08247 [Pestalotiopsis fici W106-1]|uniref:Uncharacterized protein n=1 Tax=Pestalotiopsis fici (strain W106-1 / CGMCC3.15140) TaxID=1229662 RepID=W3X3L5_PESFW|nr:uncharacterized protein PFICI_08247 [Pestalotiopsis fici W106-1]ETS80718.1 hypothetical protein PFICI_08247 [Pestalotiopsis fici W106-1]